MRGRWKDMCPVSSARLQSETGGPNISMVSSTSDKWSINEVTDTRRIRASSALHLLKHRDDRVQRMAGLFSFRYNDHIPTVFLTQITCCRTPRAVCWCRLSSAPGPGPESAEQWWPPAKKGREHPENCTWSQGRLGWDIGLSFDHNKQPLKCGKQHFDSCQRYKTWQEPNSEEFNWRRTTTGAFWSMASNTRLWKP